MGINPIQQLKTQKSPLQVKLSQGKSAEELLQKQNLDAIETIATEELTQKNEIYQGITFSTQLDQKFRKEIVTLEVEVQDDKYIVVRCRNAVLKIEEQLDTKPIEPPEVSFEKQIQYYKQMQQEDINIKMRKTCQKLKGEMRLFSQKNSQAKRICGWLIKLKNKLKNDFKEQLSYVIINDRTDFEIPWEMLELQKNDYLGASVTTVRWQDITDPDNLDKPSDLITLEVQPNDCCGKIVAYLDTSNLPNVKEEQKILQQFHHNYFENIDDFWDYLEAIDSEVSLMFIASHGFFGDNLSQVTLGENEPNPQISLTELYGYDLDFLAKSRSLVFMNACHSGRLQRDCKLNIIDPNYRTGFATFFLERGARGVIGTLNKVSDKYAAKITQNFFAEYQRDPQLSVATILRNLKAQAAKQLKKEKNDENINLFLFTFMYVYYGNPMTKLQLTQSIR